MPGRLVKQDEMTVGDHVRYIRRDGTGGRPPRVDDPDRDPTREELAEAGWRKPPRPRPTPAPPGPSTTELIENGPAAKRRKIRQLEVDLEFVQQGGQFTASNLTTTSSG